MSERHRKDGPSPENGTGVLTVDAFQRQKEDARRFNEKKHQKEHEETIRKAAIWEALEAIELWAIEVKANGKECCIWNIEYCRRHVAALIEEKTDDRPAQGIGSVEDLGPPKVWRKKTPDDLRPTIQEEQEVEKGGGDRGEERS